MQNILVKGFLRGKIMRRNIICGEKFDDLSGSDRSGEA